MKLGIFITVDGPNAVGKTTFIERLYNSLSQEYSVYLTEEPSKTSLGKFARSMEGKLSNMSYAYLIASDRSFHLETEILPKLEEVDIVICSRYIESSLVLQHYDGLDYEKIWSMNQFFIIPEISVLLFADYKTLDERLKQRDRFSYYEKEMSRQQEIVYYHEAAEYISHKGFHVVELMNESEDAIEKNINCIRETIKMLKVL